MNTRPTFSCWMEMSAHGLAGICDSCGAVVPAASEEKHTKWHQQLYNDIHFGDVPE